MGILTLTMDIVVALLLVATIAYAWVLNRRLKEWRRTREELRGVVSSFDQSIERAEKGVDQLREAAERAEGDLRKPIADAAKLRDQLQALIDATESVVGRLEEAHAAPRDAAAPSAGRAVGDERVPPRAPRRERGGPATGPAPLTQQTAPERAGASRPAADRSGSDKSGQAVGAEKSAALKRPQPAAGGRGSGKGSGQATEWPYRPETPVSRAPVSRAEEALRRSLARGH
jgi:hypothetical protein